MSIQARVAHETVGRARLQLASRRGDKDFFERLSQQLSRVGQVQKVRANPETGSVVLEFSGTLDDVIASSDGAEPIELERSSFKISAPQQPPVAARDKTFRIVSGHDINPMLMAAVLFGAVGVVQTLRGKVMIPALTAFWYAANAFRQAREPALVDAADTGRVVR
jgi:hypothetical protein